MKTYLSYFIAITILPLIVSLSSGAAANSGEVMVELNPGTISINESALLQITIQNRQRADINIPALDSLVFHRRGQSSQVQVVNGAVTSSVIYSYLVEPVKSGVHEIPPIDITLDGKTIHTEPLAITVTSSGDRGRQPATQSGTAGEKSELSFISFTPEKDKIYRGEVIPATIKVYFKRGTRINQLSLPRLQGEGLLIDELSNNPSRVEEMVDNTAYSVLIWETFVTGLKEGVLNTSFELDATLLVPSRKRSSTPGFGSGFFGDDVFGSMFSDFSSRTIRVESGKTDIEVMPLPESSRPDSFSGAIGSFTLELDARPTVITPGEPVTLTMHVAGTGNFTGVEAPRFSDSGGIKVYTPTARFTPDQSPYNGTKEFQQAIILTDPSSREVPPVAFSFFDPETGRYRTLLSDPVSIAVHPSNNETTPSPLPSRSVASTESSRPEESVSLSLVPVKLEPGRLVDRITPPFLTIWFVTALSLCVLLIAGLFGYRIYSGFQAANEEAVYKKILAAKRKETLTQLQVLNPNGPDYPARACKLVGALLIVQQRSDSASLTTTDIIDSYGSDSVLAELFRLGDGARYGKQESPAGTRQDLHSRLQTFVAQIS